MINMIQELETVLSNNNLTIEDIAWIGTNTVTIAIPIFLESIKAVYYDQQAGPQEVALDLVIAGSDWFMRRSRSYDGSERWEFIKIPTQPEVERTDITKFTIRECLDGEGFRKHKGSKYLEELNTPESPETPDTPETPEVPTPPEK